MSVNNKSISSMMSELNNLILLHDMTKKNNVDGIQKLLVSSEFKKLNIINRRLGSHDYTALHRAAYQGNIEIIEMLLDAGADPSLQNKEKETAIKAAENGKRKIVKEFIEKYSQYKKGQLKKKPQSSKFKSDKNDEHKSTRFVRENKEVFVRYLPKDMTKERLRKMFIKAGCDSKFKIELADPKNEQEKNQKYAHLFFESSSDALTAIRLMNYKIIENHVIIVQQQVLFQK
eukprot:c21559_g1_i1.p1 GENE.c21559_g1_i1~~c21559_g1_i1.p1  ORF type:complete len:231 (+),score=46.72 c21559_g1_i1:93-785(+)